MDWLTPRAQRSILYTCPECMWQFSPQHIWGFRFGLGAGSPQCFASLYFSLVVMRHSSVCSGTALGIGQYLQQSREGSTVGTVSYAAKNLCGVGFWFCLLFLWGLFVFKQEASQLKTNRITLYHKEQNLAGKLQSSLNPTV